MDLTGRSLVTIDDLSNGEIEALFSLADDMSGNMGQQLDVCRGKVMASLFFEPSTRTRLSFEAAMHRLGGDVISVADAKSTSISKGESLADTARIVGAYADIIVVRHPWEGAARVVADYAGIPVINAGDGGHEHPTQTLCDLYTIQKERKTIKGLTIALWGDLKNGRTVHSLAYALARFGATILFRPGPGLEMPEHVLRKLTTEYGGEVKRYSALGSEIGQRKLPINAMYITPNNPHQLAMMPKVSAEIDLKEGIDALYVTRLQKERFSAETAAGEMSGDYPVVDKKLLSDKEFKKTIVMHPLPRVDELSYELDGDPRAMYFKQAARGIPIRMALLSLLLGAKTLPMSKEKETFIRVNYPSYRREYGVKCDNPKCISIQENESNYIRPDFQVISLDPLTLRCVYCEHEINPPYVASSDWHEGTKKSKTYHSVGSHWVKAIRPENLIIFDSRKEAEAHGYKPGRDGRARRNTTKEKATKQA